MSTKVVADYYGYSKKDAAEAVECLKGNDVLDLAELVGIQAEDLAKIRKEYKDEQLRADGIGPAKIKGRAKATQEKTSDFFGF